MATNTTSKTSKKTSAKTTKTTKLTKAQRAQIDQALKEAMTAELAKVEKTLGTPERMWERIRRIEEDSLRSRLRLQSQPWVIAGAVVSVALLQQVAALAVHDMVCAAGTGALVAVATALLRTRTEGPWAEAGAWMREHPVRTLVIASAAWWWIFASLLVGFEAAHLLATTGLWVFLGLSAHWWRTHRIGYDPLTRPAIAVTDVASHYVALWNEHLASKAGDFQGTSLINYRPTQYGHAWDVKLRPGTRGLDALALQLDVISTALGIAKKYISFSEHETDADNPLLATLRLTTDSPTKKDVDIEVGADGVPRILGTPVWDAETGDIAIGPYADGVGTHTWGLYRKNSLLGGYLFGAQRSGKSELLNLLALGMRLSGHTTFWYLDGQGGTQPTLMRESDWDASESAFKRRLALEAAAIVVKVRGLTNKAAGAAGFTPTPERPGLVLFMDESHEGIINYRRVEPPTRKEVANGAQPDPGFGEWTNVELVNMITRIGRKVGVAIVAASQDTGLAAFGGESLGRVIRGNLFTANAALMRSEDAIGASIAPKAAMSPTELPPGGGYGAAANETGQDGGVSTRRAMWRAAFRDDQDPRGSFADLIAAAGPCLSIEPEAAYYIDELLDGAYARRHEVSAQERAEAAGEAVRAGMDGRLSAAEVLFGSPEAAHAAKNTGGGGEDLGAEIPDLDEFFSEVEDHLADVAENGVARVPAILLRARDAIETASDTRMHTEALAAALKMPAAAMQEQLRTAGVRPLKRAFSRGGREARGYDVADIDAAIAAHADTETA
ncbi:hypothetical protein ACFW53_20590 [Nocardiopsis dassonvillei]|uniref:hypothetical protein n=1 Tax=Nocardiopsis dassonvillei TaxID=2014 RepID=UPI003670B0C1